MPHHSGLTKVCLGEELVLTCTTNENGLVWRVQLINDQGRSVTHELFFFSMDLADQMQNVVVNFTNFTSRRTSAQRSSPLVSTLTITNIRTALNMTQVNCSEDLSGNVPSMTTSTIAIYIISNTGNN